MTLTTTDGRRYSRETAAPKGSTVNPLSEPDLLAKFEKWIGPGISTESRDRIVSLVRDLEMVQDVTELLQLTRPS